MSHNLTMPVSTSYKPFTQCSETAVRLMLRYHYLMGVFYSMTLYEDANLPYHTLATNGTSIWIDPNFWAQLDRDCKMTAIAHEMGHKMYLHPTRRGERNPFIWNIAGDHRINLDLKESGFKPLEGMTIDGKPWTWFCDEKYNLPKAWTTEEIYDDVYKEMEEKAKKGGKSADEHAQEAIGAAFDMVDFGDDPQGGKDESEGTGKDGRIETVADFEQRVRKELKEVETMCKMAGNMPSWMKRMIEFAEHAKVNWYDVLESWMKALHLADYSWSRFSRREFVKTGVICPDMWQPAMGGIVVYVDCSGSCWSVLGKFNMHFKDIIEQVKPEWVEVRYFQTYVEHSFDQRYERGEFDVGLRELGGGGTDFSWLGREIDDMPERPEVALVLTDMYGGFGKEPNTDVQVMWISVSAVTEAPFGEVLNVN